MSNRLNVVFVFLDSGDKNLYQLKQWLQPLQRLSKLHDVTVLYVADEVTALLGDTDLGAVQVELPQGLVDFMNDFRPKLLLYPNQHVRNFYALRYGAGIHAWVSHGESDKAYMFQNTLKRYDLYFAAGKAAEDRVLANLKSYKPGRIRRIGRPQLADQHSLPKDYRRAPDGVASVLYAPTWEGASEANRYSSISSHGLELVKRLVELGYQVVYRPHPLAGSRDASIAKADRAIRAFLRSQNRLAHSKQELGSMSEARFTVHYIDSSEFGWQLETLDSLITDLSAVAFDWLATSKPLIVTEPVSDSAVMSKSQLLKNVSRVSCTDIGRIGDLLDQRADDKKTKSGDLSSYYFETSGDFDALFFSQVQRALDEADSLPPLKADLEVFMPRGRKLGLLRYPNFLVRLFCQAVGIWRPISKNLANGSALDLRSSISSTTNVFAYFSDPFDTETIRAWAPRLYEAANNDPVLMVTNQVTTKIKLEKFFRRMNRRGTNAQRELTILACASAKDAEFFVSGVQPEQIRYLKDHPANLALLRANSPQHILWKPEVDTYFSPTHALVMYDRIDTGSAQIREAVAKIHTISQPICD